MPSTQQSRWCAGRFACAHFSVVALIGELSGHKEVSYDLRQMMLEELERRNYSQGTTHCYLRAVADFARYFHRSPDQLRAEDVRQYQAYLFRERKLEASSVTQRLAALRFF